MRFTGWLSWRLWVFTGFIFMAGASAGGLVAAWVYIQNLTVLSASLERKSARNELLELLVQQQSQATPTAALDKLEAAPSEASASAEGAAAPGSSVVLAAAAPQGAARAQQPAERPMSFASAAAAPGAVSATASLPAAAASRASAMATATIAAVAKPKELRVAAPKKAEQAALHQSHREKEPPTAPTSAITAVAIADAAPLPVRPAASPAQERQESRPVTSEEMAQAAKFRIEGVNAEKAGVGRLDAEGVHLRNGGVVRTGDYFPSGERLLSVDVENARVVTSKRQILLFFTKPAQ
jgi:hypothetical protein